MDHLFGRLITWAIVCVAAMCMVSTAHAQACVTWDSLMASCQAAAAAKNASSPAGAQHMTYSCVTVTHTATQGDIMNKGTRDSDGFTVDAGHAKGCLVPDVPPPPPPDPCASAAPMDGAFSGKLSAGSTMCSPQGNGTSCTMAFTPDSPPFMNRSGTAWATHGTYKPSGGTCTSQGQNAPPPPPAAAPPKTCGGESCYDSKNDKYCATDSSGAQICVSGAGARSPSGTCASGGDTTVCGGTPNPPKPPAPPASPISDPPTETRGSDSYPQSANGAAGTPATGGNYTTTITTYGAGASQPSSGQVTGDDGPAKPSTSGGTGTGDKKGDGTSASGGMDCNNAPSVQGSPALAMVAQQQWQTRCTLEKALIATGSPGDISTPSGDSVWKATVFSDPVAAAASHGQFDQSGMGFASTCPMHDLLVPLWQGKSLTIPFSKGCPVGEWIRAIVIAFSLLAAAKITVGSND